MCYRRLRQGFFAKDFFWDEEKNILLKKERGISFEMIKECLDQKGFLDLLDHSNVEKYPGQKIMLVEIDNYVYAIPYVETKKMIFLKTIFPSRKYTKKYLRGHFNEKKD